MKAWRTTFVLAVFATLFIILGLFSLSQGSSDTPYSDILASLFFVSDSDIADIVLWDIRMPRLFAAILTGVSLALAGCGMQSLFGNPLADPSITGVSSGAALGAVIAISFFTSVFVLEAFALSFGLICALLVCLIGRVDKHLSAYSTLLCGIAVNAFCAAIVGLFMYTIRDAGMRGFVFWSLGSLERCTYSELAISYTLAIPAWIVMFLSAKSLNVLLLGEQNAFHSGVDVAKLRYVTIASSAVMTAATVSICGIIGFVGLVVPHTIRLIIGPDNRALLPISAIAGASLVVFADIVSRLVSQTDPVPIGVITSLIGAPFFLVLLRKSGGRNA